MKFILILAGISILAYLVVPVRVVLLHPFRFTYLTIRDIYKYFRYKHYNDMKFQGMKCYQGLFGKGKTLTMVHDITKLYDRYNNKPVWDSQSKSFITQYVQILSNVELVGYPYIMLSDLSQVVSIAENQKKYDDENHIKTVTLVMIDEASVQLNSREFKKNIDPLFLNSLCCQRHFNINCFAYSSQKFCLTDKLLRDCTEYLVNCNRVTPRIMVNFVYDATDFEATSDTTKLKPIHRKGWLILDSDYGKYDTQATVGQLIKDCKEGKFITEADILTLQGVTNYDDDQIRHKSFKLRNKLKQRR